MPLQTDRVPLRSRHALIEVLAVQREAGYLVTRLQNGWPHLTGKRSAIAA